MLSKIDWYGTSDFTDVEVTPSNAVGLFARGATGRVCLVMVAHKDDPQVAGQTISTHDELDAWACSEPGGYLDY